MLKARQSVELPKIGRNQYLKRTGQSSRRGLFDTNTRPNVTLEIMDLDEEMKQPVVHSPNREMSV